ncbi:MAG TPA: hypothetical protein VIV06_12825 [Candidatus Limnocylindrales bacterium]
MTRTLPASPRFAFLRRRLAALPAGASTGLASIAVVGVALVMPAVVIKVAAPQVHVAAGSIGHARQAMVRQPTTFADFRPAVALRVEWRTSEPGSRPVPSAPVLVVRSHETRPPRPSDTLDDATPKAAPVVAPQPSEPRPTATPMAAEDVQSSAAFAASAASEAEGQSPPRDGPPASAEPTASPDPGEQQRSPTDRPSPTPEPADHGDAGD